MVYDVCYLLITCISWHTVSFRSIVVIKMVHCSVPQYSLVWNWYRKWYRTREMVMTVLWIYFQIFPMSICLTRVYCVVYAVYEVLLHAYRVVFLFYHPLHWKSQRVVLKWTPWTTTIILLNTWTCMSVVQIVQVCAVNWTEQNASNDFTLLGVTKLVIYLVWIGRCVEIYSCIWMKLVNSN